MFTEKNSRKTFAINILTEQLIENSAIILTMAVMWFFRPYTVLFNFGTQGYSMDINLLALSVTLMFLIETFGDVACLYAESKLTKLPTLEVWNELKQNHKRFLMFLMYSVWSMAVLSIIYWSARMPRIGFCSKDELCSCTYSVVNKMC